LCSDFYASDRSIFRYITNFIDFDAGVSGKSGFELLGKRSRFGITAGKCAYKAGKLRLRNGRCKVDAGNARTYQHLGKAALACRRAQRHAIKKNLRSRSAQQKSASCAVVQGVAKFFPGGFKLRSSPHVSELIQTRKF
jgi:hypothetical protein